jgi:mRNA-degrading endonuclease toxin of MazEF toxin-antitoxin module
MNIERGHVINARLSLMSEDRLQDAIGKLSDGAMRKADECLKAALGIG